MKPKLLGERCPADGREETLDRLEQKSGLPPVRRNINSAQVSASSSETDSESISA
jgi:hypothetical protein